MAGTAESPLRTWREAHGLSQEGAARLADVSLATWRNWEHGRQGTMSLPVLRRLEAIHPGLVAALVPEVDPAPSRDEVA